MSGSSNLHVLFEHAAGFAAFKVREFEEESMFVSEVSFLTNYHVRELNYLLVGLINHLGI